MRWPDATCRDTHIVLGTSPPDATPTHLKHNATALVFAAMKFKPRAYQDLIIDFQMSVPRSATWAGCGLGKSSSTLTALDRHYLMGRSQPTLVIAPLTVAKTTWTAEAEKWDHLRHIRVVPVVGSEAERRRALSVDASVYTTNYENIPWIVEHFTRWPFIHIVADESTRLKGFRTRQGTKRAKALATVAHKSKWFTELTGTPSPNGLVDLWGQMWMLDGGARLGRNYTAFMARWFKVDREHFICKPHAHSQREIHGALSDIALTINARDWFDLREPIVRNYFIELPPVARKLYDEMEEEFYIQLEEHGVEAVHAASRSQKLMQLANGAVYLDPAVASDDGSRAFRATHSAKLDALDSIVTESAGMPVLVAYKFKSDLARLMKAFPQGVAFASQTAGKTIADWNAGKIPVLFVHPASAAHGISLQDGGNILVFFSVDWNLEERLQVMERLGPTRQLQAGHDRNVFIYNILARGTIDELVLERVETKREVQDILLEAMARRRR